MPNRDREEEKEHDLGLSVDSQGLESFACDFPFSAGGGGGCISPEKLGFLRGIFVFCVTKRGREFRKSDWNLSQPRLYNVLRFLEPFKLP